VEAPGSPDDLELAPAPPADVSQLAPEEAAAIPVCVIDHSEELNRAKADLARALFVTIGGSRPAVSALQVIDVVARRYDIAAQSMSIMKATSEDFLLLPDVKMADRVLNK
jgi:hypothetical protein